MSQNKKLGNEVSNNGKKRKDWNKKGRNRGGRKFKETELNVLTNNLNAADLPHVVTEGKSNNDPSWYLHIYPAAKDVASIPFNQPIGLPYNSESKPGTKQYIPGINSTIGFGNADSYYNIMPNSGANVSPGIMKFRILPTLGGKVNGPTAPANIAAQQIYTLTRKANSGAKNYDKTDLMMVILAMDSAYMLYEWLLRIYKCLGVYNYMSRYVPDALLSAMHVSPALMGEMADFRAKLNLFAYQLGSINVPDQFDFIHRHSWLFSNIYKDHKGMRSQLYFYDLEGLYIWTEGQNSDPSSLTMKYMSQLISGDDDTMPGNSYLLESVSQIQNMIDAIMQPLLGSEDVGIISGDLAKAFGEGGMIKLQAITENEAISPVYDEEVLYQMMNMTAFDNGNLIQDSFNITQVLTNTTVGPYLYQTPAISILDNVGGIMTGLNKLLNFIETEPTPEMVMVATRLMASCSETSGSQRLIDCGTEICVGITITNKQLDGDNIPQIVHTPISQYPIIAPSSDESGAGVKITDIGLRDTWMSNWSAFDWAPTIYAAIMRKYGAQGYRFNVSIIQDVDDYAWLTEAELKRLHEVAVMSEYAVKDYPNALSN